MATTREMIRDFSLAFERPVNESLTMLTVSDRELLGKLLFEEVVEYVTKGLGLAITFGEDEGGAITVTADSLANDHTRIVIDLNEGQKVDPIECADGLADVNVVIHFNAHWQGINLDRATEIVHGSNMSKLDPEGRPIINGVTPGYRDAAAVAGGAHRIDHCHFDEFGFDPSKPIGKILKGPNFYEPKEKLLALIQEERNNRG